MLTILFGIIWKNSFVILEGIYIYILFILLYQIYACIGGFFKESLFMILRCCIFVQVKL